MTQIPCINVTHFIYVQNFHTYMYVYTVQYHKKELTQPDRSRENIYLSVCQFLFAKLATFQACRKIYVYSYASFFGDKKEKFNTNHTTHRIQT